MGGERGRGRMFQRVCGMQVRAGAHPAAQHRARTCRCTQTLCRCTARRTQRPPMKQCSRRCAPTWRCPGWSPSHWWGLQGGGGGGGGGGDVAAWWGVALSGLSDAPNKRMITRPDVPPPLPAGSAYHPRRCTAGGCWSGRCTARRCGPRGWRTPGQCLHGGTAGRARASGATRVPAGIGMQR